MRFNLTTILVLIIIVLLGGGYFMYNEMNQDLQEEREAKKEAFIKNDELKKVADGWYQKYVADTATTKELEKLVDSLQVIVDNPKGGGTITIRPTDTIQVTDTVIVNNTTKKVEIIDYYPNKENYFLKYSNNFYIGDSTKGTSKFEWTPINVDVIISEVGGKFKADFQVPSYVNIDNVEIRATPMSVHKSVDRVGYLLGGDWGNDLTTGTNYIEVGGGIRFMKLYGLIEFNTLNQVEFGLKYEF